MLCSVDDELATVKQIFRVLKPGATLAGQSHNVETAVASGTGHRSDLRFRLNRTVSMTLD